jgi:cobalt-zinc-cadmium efflux system protein
VSAHAPHHGHASHGHGNHGHAPHDHGPTDFGRAFAIGIALNTGFVVVEAGYGFATNAMSLVADAGHNLSDVLGLVVAWIAATLAKRPPSARFTYGWRGASILSVLFNAVFLLVISAGIAWAAIGRLIHPEPVGGVTVMVVAALGILVNGGSAWLFSRGNGDLNIRGAYLHLLADAAVSAGVVVAGLGILATGWNRLDPLVSLGIAALIVWSTWGLLREGLAMSLSAAPRGVDAEEIRRFLGQQPGIVGLHDLHVWSMSTTEVALTAHLVVAGGHPGNRFLFDLGHALQHRFGIAHPTFQVEDADGPACPLAGECRS